MSAQTISNQTEQRRRPISWSKVAAWLVIISAIVIIIIPFLWVIRTALSTQRELLAQPKALLPVGFTYNNFLRVLGQVDTATAVAAGGSGQQINFWLFLRNSIIVTSLIVVCQTFFSSLAAYAFARLKFPLRDKIFFLYLTALMIPGIVTLIPNYLLIRELDWDNTFLGIVAPYLLMSPFAVFFLRQFFLGINKEIEEAASLDGAGKFTIFWRIIVPISGPPIATLAILTFVTSWNNYLWPFIVGNDESVRVLTVALAIFRSQTPQGAPDWTGLMAATIISMLPTLLVFGLVGRRVVNNLQFTGFK
ncbi:MAG: carbohydrate ABC transporter permease [Anaerolineales bacterium]|nr:carbohydrate ABC transporter permease [Anaerolineales bacterium]MCB0005629.1 carbohydrate ABC transporter permease [Anaerolineales bacterium]